MRKKRKMRRIRAGVFVKVCRIAKEDRDHYKYREDLTKGLFSLLRVLTRAGPWVSAIVMVVGKDICLNGTKFKKGDHLWLHKTLLKSISHI